MRYLCILAALLAVSCGDVISSPSAVPAGASGVLASCADVPPGQFPSGNPAQAPGNSSTNDHDCKNP